MDRLTPEQVLSFEAAAKAMVKWLNDHCNPHCQVIVDTSGAELVEGQLYISCPEYIKD